MMCVRPGNQAAACDLRGRLSHFHCCYLRFALTLSFPVLHLSSTEIDEDQPGEQRAAC